MPRFRPERRCPWASVVCVDWLQIGLVADDRAASGMRGQDSLKAVGIDVQIRHQNQRWIIARLLRRYPLVGSAFDRAPGRARVTAEVVVADGNPVIIVDAPAFSLLHPECQAGTVQGLELARVAEQVRFRLSRKNWGVGVQSSFLVIGAAGRKLSLRCHPRRGASRGRTGAHYSCTPFSWRVLWRSQSAGSSMPARIAMMAITTSSSIKVNARPASVVSDEAHARRLSFP